MEENKMALDFEKDFLDEDELIFLPKAEQKQPDTVEEIVIKQYKMGMTLKALTTNHGLSYGKVYEILNSNGVKLRHGRYNDSKSGQRLTTMSQLEKSSIIMDYTAGLDIKSLLDRYNINKHGLYSILDEANVPRRHKKQFIALDIETIQNSGTQEEEIFTVTPASPELKLWREGNRLYVNIFVNEEDMKGIQEISYQIEKRQKTTPFTPFKEEK